MVPQGSMDVTMSEAPNVQFNNIPDQLVPDAARPPSPESQRETRHCLGDPSPGEFPLASVPTMVLHILTSCNLDPVDLAKLEATCSFFRRPMNLIPELELSMSEVAALEMCQKRAIFKPMKPQEREALKERCGGSWKLVLKFLLAGEGCYRREKSQVTAGGCHSVVVTSGGDVYTFGLNCSGQLGHSTTDNEWQPRQISSLKGIRIIQAAAGAEKTMLVSDSGQVYAFGKDKLRERGDEHDQVERSKSIAMPTLMESLKGVFVVQAVTGELFMAVLSREGRVYTFCWGKEEKLGHLTDPNDMEPHPLNGALENVPVVQIAAGHCYLLALAFQPSGMSVYSVGCGQGGKLGHGSTGSEKQPRLITQFQMTLNLQPMAISAGTWHAAVLGHDGRVCTWGWGSCGCLGHGIQAYQIVPKVVEGFGDGKAVHIATGEHTTFVVLDNGDIYSFGALHWGNLGHDDNFVVKPRLVTSLTQKELHERIVQISPTNNFRTHGHTIALTESGKIYAFGMGDKGQLGTKLPSGQSRRTQPKRVNIDLS
ncbi:ultraviolet-B receptor UVR8-like [Punica granatum]|uniref:Ultraviolet-B receptor UVR8-like n=1 Tax=Punica granatum TaxID=22663 RepID=A0A6P8EAS2_PUNGR|nr:ultraviolet-B receptor UVR8-like [Punica granatum]